MPISTVTGFLARRGRNRLPVEALAVDDASRVAWADVREAGETQTECVVFLRELVAWYAARGVAVTGVMSDNGCAVTCSTSADRRRALPAWLHAPTTTAPTVHWTGRHLEAGCTH